MVEAALKGLVQGVYLLAILFPSRDKQMLQQLYLANGVL
jgi:hypothetical protein